MSLSIVEKVRARYSVRNRILNYIKTVIFKVYIADESVDDLYDKIDGLIISKPTECTIKISAFNNNTGSVKYGCKRSTFTSQARTLCYNLSYDCERLMSIMKDDVLTCNFADFDITIHHFTLKIINHTQIVIESTSIIEYCDYFISINLIAKGIRLFELSMDDDMLDMSKCLYATDTSFGLHGIDVSWVV